MSPRAAKAYTKSPLRSPDRKRRRASENFDGVELGCADHGNQLNRDLAAGRNIEPFIEGPEAAAGRREDIKIRHHLLAVDHDIEDPLPRSAGVILRELQIHVERAGRNGELIL